MISHCAMWVKMGIRLLGEWPLAAEMLKVENQPLYLLITRCRWPQGLVVLTTML